MGFRQHDSTLNSDLKLTMVRIVLLFTYIIVDSRGKKKSGGWDLNVALTTNFAFSLVK